MKAAAYARYSTDKQTENSIDAQLSAIAEYCTARGHTLTATCVDMAMSGTNTERPDFQRMLADAREQRFECIVVYDMSRASRDVVDWLSFRKLMCTLDIAVLSTTERLGSIDDPNAFLTEMVTAVLGQHMVLQTRQKSIAGVAEKAKQAVFLGGVPPLGYDAVGGKYIINRAEAEAVRLIFFMHADGCSYDKIIDAVQARGFVGKRGKPIGKNSLYAILSNERYIGVYIWNKRLVKHMGNYAGRKPNPRTVRIVDAMPAIIDRDTWERVQARMKDNKRRAANTAKNEYMLSGLIECGVCGATYTGKTNTNSKGYTTRYYVCGNKYRTHTCKARNLNADELELAVVMQLRAYFESADFDTMADEIYTEFTQHGGTADEDKAELVQVEREITNLIRHMRAGVEGEEIHEEHARLQVRKHDLQERLAVPKDFTVTREEIAERLKKDAQSLLEGDTKRLVKKYVSKIYAHSDEIIITGGVNFIGCGDRI